MNVAANLFTEVAGVVAGTADITPAITGKIKRLQHFDFINETFCFFFLLFVSPAYLHASHHINNVKVYCPLQALFAEYPPVYCGYQT